MNFDSPLVPATLLRRYKRFLADAELGSGETVTAHCPNTGSMMGVAEPGFRIWLEHRPSPTRKYAYGWELTELPGGTRVGVNTHRSNALVREALEARRFADIGAFGEIVSEVKFGKENSRADFVLRSAGSPDRFVEVKNVTAAVRDGIAVFPDAVSERGTKHLRELMGVVASGARALLVFCVQRADVREVRPADDIDPVYGRTLRAAIAAGVTVRAWGATVAQDRIELDREMPVHCP